VNIGIMGNKMKQELSSVLAVLVRSLESHNVHIIADDELRELLLEIPRTDEIDFVPLEAISRKCDLLITIGGDGTILNAAKIIGNSHVPILGINLGKLGFLAEISVRELEEMLEEYFSEKYSIDERVVLTAKNSFTKTVVFAMNDIVVDKGASFRIIDIDAFVDNDYLGTFAADGIIVATSTGSTAYSLASSGPIIIPSCESTVITLISPHNLTTRPVVVPLKSEIRLKVLQSHNQIHLVADGQNEQFFAPPIEFSISPASHRIRLIKKIGHSYFDTLRTKLMWGKRYAQESKTIFEK
jgi:NAD+ kinase